MTYLLKLSSTHRFQIEERLRSLSEMHSELADSNATMATPVPMVKSTAVLKKTCCRPNLNWNQEMVLALVMQVQTCGAHISNKERHIGIFKSMQGDKCNSV